MNDLNCIFNIFNKFKLFCWKNKINLSGIRTVQEDADVQGGFI